MRRVYDTTTEGNQFVSFYEEGMLCGIVQQTIEPDGFGIYAVTARVLEQHPNTNLQFSNLERQTVEAIETDNVPTRFVAYNLY